MKTPLSLRRYLAQITAMLVLPLITLVAQTNCVAPAAGLVSWWRAEGNAADAAGTNHGTLMGGLSFTTGEVGQAFNFDGVDDHVLVADDPSLNFVSNQDFSIEAWIQPQMSTTTFDVMTIVDKRNAPDTTHGIGYELAVVGGRLECRISDSLADGGTTFGAAGPDLRDGRFHHVAVTLVRNSTTGGHYYVDGAAVLTFDPTVEPGDLSNDQPLRIGRHPTPSVFAQFKGKIDEVSIYQRALGATEIQAIYTASSAGKCVATNPPSPPVIVFQPASQSVLVGADATFSVTAGGTAPLSYQWRFNGANLNGATASSLVRTNVQLGDAGNYAVVVSNRVGTVTSSNAVLTVNAVPPVTLLNVNFAAYDQVKTGFAATGQTGSDFWNGLWFPDQSFVGFGGLKRADGTATAAGLTVQNGAGATGFSHPDLMYRSCCYAQDFGDITLTVTNLPAGAYDFYLYGHAGANAANTVFQLRVGGNDFGNKSTATDSSWSLTTWVEGAQYVVYRGVTVTNGGAPVIVKCHPGLSGYTILNGMQIMAAGSTPPVIASQPASQSVLVGADATFSVTAGGTAPLSYQWRFNGANLNGATASSLVRTNVQLGDAGNYAVVVSNRVGTATSSNAVLTVNAASPVTLLNVNFAAYDQVKTGLAATGQTGSDFWNSLTFPFQTSAGLGGLKRADGTATGAGLTVQNGAGHTEFSHPDLMYRSCCYARDFGVITLTVTNLPAGEYDIYLYGHAGDNTANTVFQLLVGGNDFGNKSTATDSSWSLTTWVEGAQYVVYRGVTVTNGGAPVIVKCHPGVSGYTFLNGVQIMAAGSTPPVIASQPASRSVLVGADATFSVTAGGTAPLSYQWLFNGTNLNGATGSVLALNQVTVSAAGFYSVRVTNTAGSVVSSSAALTVVHYASNALINVNFGGHLTPEGLSSNKVGLAAIGRTTSDLWNFYSRDIAPGQYRQNGALANLQQANGSATTVGLVVNNAPGAWFNGSTDVMYHGYLYPWSGNATLTVTNLPAGVYDVYLYSGQANCQLTVGGTSYGIRTTYDVLTANPTVWVEGVQYARFAGVTVAAGQAATMIVSPGASGTAAIAGLQIVGLTSSTPLGTNIPPAIVSQPQSQTVLADVDVAFEVTASGTTPLNYQWSRNGTNLNGATDRVLALNQVEVGTAGYYSVRVTNTAGSVVSSSAALTVVRYASNALINVNFGGHLTPEGLNINKVGLAAVGRTTNDLWNFYSRDIAPGQYRLSGALANLQQADGSAAAAGLVVNNAPGAWFNGSTDVMYHGYLYPFNGNVTLTVTNLPAGQYEVYLYSGQGNCQLSVGGTDYGTRTTYDGLVVNPTVWSEGVQYAHFGNVQVLAGQAVTMMVSPGAGGTVAIAGLQIAGTTTNAPHATIPAITSQPQSQAVLAGADAAFEVTASGTAPLSYQWRFNGVNLNGATASSLVRTNVQLSSAGNYSVVVSNGVGSVASSNALLTVLLPPATVQILGTKAMAGSTIEVPVVLVANGNENALSFSLNFNTQRLAFAEITLGGGAPGAALLSNTTQAGSGTVGIAVALETGLTFAAGTQEVARVAFTTSILGGNQPSDTPIIITNQPVNKLLANPNAQPLPATYLNGLVTLSPTGLEGDASPRVDGNQALDLFDWVQVGRYVAGLDTISNANEFQRVDCAPRSTLGDGKLKVTDWVQAGRYATGLDPVTFIGGPAAPVLPRPATGGPSPRDGEVPRLVRIANGEVVNGLTVTLPLVLQSLGNENGLGFSLNFDPSALRYAGAVKGSAALSATLHANAAQASSGKVGLVLALPMGSSFVAGTQEIVRVTFIARTSVAGKYPVVLGDQPVWRAVSDSTALELTTVYVNNEVMVRGRPALAISQSGTNVILSWPSWAGDFILEAADAPAGSPMNWSTTALAVQTNGATVSVALPTSALTMFFRLFHP